MTPESSKQNIEKIILAGNPNVGKSVIFSSLTGKYVVVSNYSGTTVELTKGHMKAGSSRIEVIDTPGIDSLLPKSEDEIVTLEILLTEDNYSVVQVINSTNLKRGLFITAQLMMMGVPLTVDLNIVDEARSRGIMVDAARLEELLGVPVVETVATRRKGLKKLRSSSLHPGRGRWEPRFLEPVENAIEEISKLLPAKMKGKRFIPLLLLTNSSYQNFPDLNNKIRDGIDSGSMKKIEKIKKNLSSLYSGDINFQINNQIHRAVDEIFRKVTTITTPSESRVKTFLSNMMLHPVWGLPVVFAILWIVYMIVGKFGAGDVVDYVEGTVFGEWLNPVVIGFVELFTESGFIYDMLVGDFGLWTMGMTYAIAIVMPIVGLFFFIFGILEDSGYLPRLAVMLNKPFRFMGLSGKAVLPMVLGLGCATMATMTARILHNKKERIIVTLLLALAIPCSAQLGVIMGMLSVLPGGAILWWLGSITIVLILVGRLASILMPGENSLFVQEISPLRMPQPKNLLVKTFARIQWYLKEAVPLFLIATFILFILNRTGAIRSIESAAEPLLTGLMGLPKEAASAFVMGFLRRDYAATGLFDLSKAGMLTPVQALVSLVAITLFIPCVANLFIIIKERGMKTAIWMTLFIIPFAIGFASLLNLVLKTLGITFT